MTATDGTQPGGTVECPETYAKPAMLATDGTGWCGKCQKWRKLRKDGRLPKHKLTPHTSREVRP